MVYIDKLASYTTFPIYSNSKEDINWYFDFLWYYVVNKFAFWFSLIIYYVVCLYQTKMAYIMC